MKNTLFFCVALSRGTCTYRGINTYKKTESNTETKTETRTDRHKDTDKGKDKGKEDKDKTR
jgi:hypothetical protein